MFDSMSLSTVLKNTSYVAVFAASIEWLGYSPAAVGALGILMAIDVLTGVTRSVTVSGGPSFTSALLTRGILAKGLLLTMLFSLAIAVKGLGVDIDGLGQSIVSVLILSELYSIIGNIHSINTKEQKVEFDAVKYLLDQTKRILDKIIKK